MELTEPEQWLIEFLRREAQACAQLAPLPGARYPCLAHLFLDRGRLFTPASSPAGIEQRNRQYYRESLLSIRGSAAGLYAEGWVWGLRRPSVHSWCATADGAALDAAPRSTARAYLGLPFRTEAVAALATQRGALLLRADGTPTPTAVQWMHDGIPEGVLEDVGRSVPGGVEGLAELEWM